MSKFAANMALAKNFMNGHDSSSSFINSYGELQTNATNSTLLKDQHKLLFKEVKEISRRNMTLLNDLRSKGLTRNLGGLGVMIAEWERSGDLTDAEISMDGRTTALNDKLTFDLTGTPVPIIHKSFELNQRHLLASGRDGRPRIDVTQAAIASRLVAEKNEDMILNGVAGLVVDGKTITGYRTHPDRITGTLPASWATAAGTAIINDVKGIVEDFRDDKQFGEITLYVAENVWSALQLDYSATKGTNTILERILAMPQIASVQPCSILPASEVIAITLERETVEIGIAQDTSIVQWGKNIFETEFKVFNALTPILKSDKNGAMALGHYTV